MTVTDLIPGARHTVAHHWPIAAHIARYLSGMLGLDKNAPTQTIQHGTYQTIAKSLLWAEALMRRMLILIAMSFPAPKITKRAEATKKKPNSAKRASKPATRRPFFSLVEPLGALPGRDAPKPKFKGPMPRAYVWYAGRVDPPRPAPPPTYTQMDERDASRLIARVSGLIDAIENTGHHAARMARWIRSRQLQSYDLYNLPARICPIKYGRPPDASKKRMGENVFRDYKALNNRAHDAIDLGYDDSS